MGDCGAFAYVKEEEPPFTVDEVIDFYEDAGFDLGVSVDHVILGFRSDEGPTLPGMDGAPDGSPCTWRASSWLDIVRGGVASTPSGWPRGGAPLPIKTPYASCNEWATKGLLLEAWFHSRRRRS
jgi:hypothetical protein